MYLRCCFFTYILIYIDIHCWYTYYYKENNECVNGSRKSSQFFGSSEVRATFFFSDLDATFVALLFICVCHSWLCCRVTQNCGLICLCNFFLFLTHHDFVIANLRSYFVLIHGQKVQWCYYLRVVHFCFTADIKRHTGLSWKHRRTSAWQWT